MSLLARLAAALSLMLASPALAQQPPSVTAIIGADVLPMTDVERLSDQTVLIADGRIASIGPRARVRIPPGAHRIQARGMTLMPGLVDMHVHIAPMPGAAGDSAHRAMAVMLGHGVTTARAMIGSPNNLVVRDAIERGILSGPRLYVAAPGLGANNTPTPEAARAAVAAAREAGYDFMKTFNIPDLVTWQALQDAAREARLAVAGHVANEIGTERAAAADQQIEHLDGMVHALLPQGSPGRQVEFGQFPPPEVIALLASISDAELDALSRRLAAARSWHVPTLRLFELLTDVGVPTETLLAAPELRYVPDPVIAQWTSQRAQFTEGFTAESARAFGEFRRRLVRALHRAGVPMMAGSDSAQAFQLWGPGLIGEVQSLHAAGLSPIEALRSATVVPRDYFRSRINGGSSLGWRADFGTVEPGARADLILLRGDPSRDLANLRRLDTVIAAGRIYDRSALDNILDDASRAAKAVN